MNFLTTASLLDACVLSAVSSGDTYGYELTQKVAKVMEVSESSLYPVLRRLQKEQCLETYDSPHNGRNRRYYRITSDGEKRLTEHRKEWEESKKTLDKLLKGGNVK